MFKVNVTGPSRGEIARLLETEAAKVVDAKTKRIMDRAVRIAEQMASSELTPDRTPDRRRSGSLRYTRGFTVTRSGPSLPMRVALVNRSKAANIIEHGSKPHEIRGNPNLRLPGRNPGVAGRTGQDIFGARATAFGPRVRAGRSFSTVVPKVDHPGTRPYKIMERALRQAFREEGIRLS